MSAATDAIGRCVFIGTLYELEVPSRDCHVASLLAMTHQGACAGNGARHRFGCPYAASRTGLAVPAPTGPVRIERRPAYDPFFIFQSSVFIIPYFIHPPAGDGKPYDKTSGNSLPFVQISPEPPDLSLTTGAFIDKIISENKGAVCPLQQARQPAKNLFVTHDPNTRDQYRRTTQWIKNASLP